MRPSRSSLIRRALALPECKEAMRASARNSWADPEVRAKRIAALKLAAADPKKRQRRIVMIRRAKRDDDARSIVSKSMQNRWGGNKLTRAAESAIVFAPRVAFDLDTRIEAAFHLHDLAAFEAALAASAQELGLSLRKARKGNNFTAAGHARRLASYLAVSFFGVPRRRLVEARGLDRRGLRRICNLTEEMRDDPQYDALVAKIEARLG